MKSWIVLLLAGIALEAHAGMIEIAGRVGFSPVEEKVIQLANQGFRGELEALPWRIRIEKQTRSDRGSRTDFGGKRITIVVAGELSDSYEFAGTVCHELGHVLSHSALVTARGREMRDYVPGYTDVEGECDYFAAAKCIPRIAAALPPLAESAVCKGSLDPARCSIVAETGLRTVQGMARRDPQHHRGTVDFGTQTWDMDPAATYSGYGDYACRLRTFVAGAWCEADQECMKGPGARPRCWYVPGTPASFNRYGN